LVDHVKGVLTPAINPAAPNLIFRPGAVVEWVMPTKCNAYFQDTTNVSCRLATTGDRTVITELIDDSTARYRTLNGSAWVVNLSELKVIG
jgi:hypothetical protein